MAKKKKVFQRLTTVCLTLIGLLIVVTSCNDDGEKLYDVTHKVVYKAEGSKGVDIKYIEYSELGLKPKPVEDASGISWTSPEVTYTEKLPMGKISTLGSLVFVKAIGTDESSTLKVQIYVDGVLKKEEKVTGQILETGAVYNIEYKVN